MGINTVISFCTNDTRFLSKCIEEASHFSEKIIVPVCDHFFNGTPENRDLLHAVYAQHPTVQFIEFPYSHTQLYPSHLRYTPNDKEWTAHWNSLARLIGFYYSNSEWLLFLDTDEIVEGKRFAKSMPLFEPYNAIRLACYYYVLKPFIRANKIQDLTLLVRRNSLKPHHFFQPDERYGLFLHVEGEKIKGLRGIDQKPLIHHYSWVRPEHECQKKASTWSHRLDKDWQAIVQELFQGKGLSALFGTDLAFEEISEIYFDPLQAPLPPPASHPINHVIRLQPNDFLRLELEWQGLM